MRRTGGDVGVQREHRVDEGSASSLAWISAALLVRSSRPAESWRFSTLPKVSAAPSQRCCRPMLLASWIGQRTLVAPSSCELLAGLLARDELVLADVGEGVQVLEDRAARVHGHQRDARLVGRVHRALDRVRVRSGDGDAVAARR